MQYQIKDGSGKLLGENEYLVPVKISKQGLMEELETALAVTTDRGGFLSYKNVVLFYLQIVQHKFLLMLVLLLYSNLMVVFLLFFVHSFSYLSFMI